MRCLKCGTEIPENSLYCPSCGSPVQIVPDYSSLENLLADEVKDVLNEQEDKTKYMNGQGRYRDQPTYRDVRDGRKAYTNPDIRDGRKAYTNTGGYGNSAGYNTPEGYGNSGSGSRRNGTQDSSYNYDRDRGYREDNRNKEDKKTGKAVLIAVIAVIVVVLLGVAAFFIISNNSYSSKMKKADRYYQQASYENALGTYNEASKLDPTKGAPYVGMGRCYLLLNQPDQAVIAYKKSISIEPSYPDAYLALAQYYESIGDLDSITSLFSGVEDVNVLKVCSDYVAPIPAISPEAGTFEDEVTLTITAAYGSIHYTMDGSDAGADSPEYTEPIVLNENGAYSIHAVVINEKGFYSRQGVAEFTINIPSPDGPVVSPAAGTYDKPTQISVEVPADSVVYYTLDGSDPTTESEVYTGPVSMPEGRTTFSCVAVNSKGKASSIIRRQYNLIVLK